MNLNTFLLIDGSLMLISLPFLVILKGEIDQKFFTFYPYLNSIVDPLSVYGSTSNRTYLLVEWSL